MQLLCSFFKIVFKNCYCSVVSKINNESNKFNIITVTSLINTLQDIRKRNEAFLNLKKMPM